MSVELHNIGITYVCDKYMYVQIKYTDIFK